MSKTEQAATDAIRRHQARTQAALAVERFAQACDAEADADEPDDELAEATAEALDLALKALRAARLTPSAALLEAACEQQENPAGTARWLARCIAEQANAAL